MNLSRGFTLIELLVALAIVAIVSVMAFVGLSQVIDQQQIAAERAQRWRDVQLAIRIINQDMVQLHPRPVREPFGEGYLPSILASPEAEFALEFSRGGWPNPAGFPRGNVARVAYDWEDSLLVRYHWPVIDRTPSTLPVRTELLDGVQNIEVRFLDNGGNSYLEWPPQFDAPGQSTARPRAVEFLLELEDYGEVWRLMETSG